MASLRPPDERTQLLHSPLSADNSYSSNPSDPQSKYLPTGQSTSIQATSHDNSVTFQPDHRVTGLTWDLNRPSNGYHSHAPNGQQEGDLESSSELSGRGLIGEETGEPHDTYNPRESIPPSLIHTAGAIHTQNRPQEYNNGQNQNRHFVELRQRVKERACTKCFIFMVVAFLVLSAFVGAGYGCLVGFTYTQCEDLNTIKDIYSNDTILVASGLTKDCHSTISASSVSTSSSDIDQQIDLYITPCSNLKYYGFINNKEFITLNNWTISLRLFDNAYWLMGSNMSIDVEVSVFPGDSTVLYVCLFNNSTYFREFIDNENWQDIAKKNAVNCTISPVSSPSTKGTAKFFYKALQSGYHYVGLRPTNMLATLDIHTQGIEYRFNNSDYAAKKCSITVREPCKFTVPTNTLAEQCVLSYAVPPADVSRGYSSVHITSPAQNDNSFIGTTAGAGAFVFVLIVLFLFIIVLYLVLPNNFICRRNRTGVRTPLLQ